MPTTEQRTSGRTCYAQKQHDLALALVSASGAVCCAKLSRGVMGRRERKQKNASKQTCVSWFNSPDVAGINALACICVYGSQLLIVGNDGESVQMDVAEVGEGRIEE